MVAKEIYNFIKNKVEMNRNIICDASRKKSMRHIYNIEIAS